MKTSHSTITANAILQNEGLAFAHEQNGVIVSRSGSRYEIQDENKSRLFNGAAVNGGQYATCYYTACTVRERELDTELYEGVLVARRYNTMSAEEFTAELQKMMDKFGFNK